MKFERSIRRGMGAALAVVLLLSATPAMADRYQSDRSGHPLRIVAYIVHPIGVLLDYMIMRPAHWVGGHEPLATIFGHDEF